MIDFRRLDGQGSFTFLRHGESEGNNDGVLQGRKDYPLSDAGREQAGRAAAWFKRQAPRIDCLLTSPLARADQTARVLASELGLPKVTVRPELTEADTGIFTGMTRAAIRAAWPEEYARFLAESWEAVPGAERIDALYARAEAVWALLFELFAGGRRNILAVTHSGFLQWLLKTTLGHRCWMPVFPVANCGICRLSVDNPPAGGLYCEWTAVNLSPF
jgi:broad specificity phosphatase PhoE